MKSTRIGLAVLAAVFFMIGAAVAGDAKQVKLDVKGMMCDHCQGKVKSSLEKVAGVKNADVDWNSGSAVVTLDKADVKDEDLIKAVKSIGNRYDAKVASDEKEHKENKAKHH
ncbi:MAG: cation transporter [Acidobacteria bacterium]|nr:cation transporter [Acidobacteriota bacterium]MBI3657308.1 cation transporter [Acidobacteriota bacterium]